MLPLSIWPKATLVGFEPTTFEYPHQRLEVQRAIHCATEPIYQGVNDHH